MKIRTITCHEVYNHGASLQEYALLYYLNENGHEASAIHYKPFYLSQHLKLNVVSNPKFDKIFIKQLYLLAKLPQRIINLKRKKAFDAFSYQYIPTDPVLYKNNQELKENLPDAEAFICGSDQIWNSYFENGKDPAFYLNFVPASKIKISYAASFATDDIEDFLKPFVKENVSNLNAVGVREISGVKILNDLGIQNVVQVMDPVFLLDEEHWRTNFVTIIRQKFIFVYDFDSNPLIEKIAKDYALKLGCKIFTVNKNVKYADQNFYYDGPKKFLSLMQSAQLVITNSFHSVAFSILFKKQFLVVNRTEKINTRMRDLLEILNLNEFIIHSYEDYKERNPILNKKNDYESELKKLVAFSKKFLNQSLQ